MIQVLIDIGGLRLIFEVQYDLIPFCVREAEHGLILVYLSS